MAALIDVAGKTAYLDANILIYFVEAHAKYSPLLVDLFDAIDQGRINAVTSELSLAECLVKPFLDQDITRQQTYQDFLVSGPHLNVAAISRTLLIVPRKLVPNTSSGFPTLSISRLPLNLPATLSSPMIGSSSPSRESPWFNLMT